MYGFEAISSHNGWAMALAGALIVFSGLVVLSAVISQLHKVLDLFEGRFKRSKPLSGTDAEMSPAIQLQQAPTHGARFLDDANQVVEQYKKAAEPLDEPFPLTELYRLAQEMDAPHPHLTISYLRQHRHLVPMGEGLFAWQHDNSVNG